MSKDFLSHISDEDYRIKADQYIRIQMEMLEEKRLEIEKLERLLKLRRKHQNILGMMGSRDYLREEEEVGSDPDDEKRMRMEYTKFFTLFCPTTKEILEFLGLDSHGEYERLAFNKSGKGMTVILEHFILDFGENQNHNHISAITTPIILDEERMFEFLERFSGIVPFTVNSRRVNFEKETMVFF